MVLGSFCGLAPPISHHPRQPTGRAVSKDGADRIGGTEPPTALFLNAAAWHSSSGKSFSPIYVALTSQHFIHITLAKVGELSLSWPESEMTTWLVAAALGGATSGFLINKIILHLRAPMLFR